MSSPMVKQLRRSVEEARRSARTSVRSIEKRLATFERRAKQTVDRLLPALPTRLSFDLARGDDVRKLADRVEALHKKFDRLQKGIPKTA